MDFGFILYGNTYAVNGRSSGVLPPGVAKLNWAILTPSPQVFVSLSLVILYCTLHAIMKCKTCEIITKSVVYCPSKLYCFVSLFFAEISSQTIFFLMKKVSFMLNLSQTIKWNLTYIILNEKKKLKIFGECKHRSFKSWWKGLALCFNKFYQFCFKIGKEMK